jgi:3-oxoadipate enol-lactonase
MYATLNSIRLAYSDRGQRQTQALLLIHGFPLNRHMWDAQLEGLTDQFRVIAPDLRGAGGSDVPSGPYHVDQYADDLAALLAHLNITQAVVGGLSMGGYVAFALLRRHPQRVRGLILLDTRPDPDSPEARANRDAAMTRVQQDGAAPFAREQLHRLLAPASLENTRLAGKALAIMAAAPVPGIVGTLYSLRDRPDSRPTLPTIKVPTLVIVGDQDQVTPPSVARDMARAIPGARLSTIRQAGHLSPMEQPRAVNRAIREFMNKLLTPTG